MGEATDAFEGNIWRYYYKKRMNILKGTQDIHDKIFNETSSWSSYGIEDATLLTAFFREYKKVVKEDKAKNGSIADKYFLNLFGSQIKVPGLDFSLGGNASNKETAGGGFLFEAELQALLDKAFQKDTDKVAGSSTTTSTLYLGKTSVDKDSEAFFKELLGEKAKEIQEAIGANFIEVIEEDDEKTKNVYLKTAAARAGKIDVAGKGEESLNIEITIEGKNTQKIERIMRILSNATFSVKSYTSKSAVHLGDTKGYKAIPAVAEWVGTDYARGAALYYLHHQEEGSDEKIRPDQKDTEKKIYEHYRHMKKVYELTGLGLSYSDLQKTNVDFLLVNRAGGSKITVYSVKDLIEHMKNHKRFSYREVEKLYGEF